MKRTTKTGIAALLTAVTVISACGNGSGTAANNEMQGAANALKEEMGEEAFNEAASAIKDELEKDNAKETEAAAEEETVKEIVPTDEILNADMFSNKLQLGNTVFSFPISAKEFFDKGAVLADGKDPSVQIVTGLNPGAFFIVSQTFKVKYDGYEFTAHVFNRDEENKFLTDCDIDHVGLDENVLMPGGIKIGSSISDLNEKWGEPQVDNLNTREYIKDYVEIKYPGSYNAEYKNVSGSSYKVYLDLDNGVIKNIDRRFSTDDTDELMTETGYTYPLGTISYSIPKKLKDCYMLFEYGGKRFVLQKGSLKSDKRPDIGEFTDDSVKEYIDGFSYDDEYVYDYRINGSVFTLVEALNHKNYAEINVAKYTDDDRYIYMEYYIVTEGDEESVTADVIKSQYDLLFAIADSFETVSD